MLRVAKLIGIGAAVVMLALAAGNSRSFSLAQSECTMTVYPGTSIQGTIDRASPGAIVCVRAGTYEEGVSITKPLTLRGEGRSSVTVIGALSITNAVNVAVESLTLQGGRGLVAVNSSKVALREVEVVESESVGVLVNNSSIEISQSLISANKLQGIAISLNSSAVIASNDITKNGSDGIAVSGSSAEVKGNFIVENKGCGLKAEGATLTGGSNVVDNNAGGNLCGAPATLQGAPLPPPTSLRVNPQDWTNAPLLDWDNPAGVEIGAAWYKLGSEPRSRFDGTRTTQKPITLSNLPEGEKSITIYLWLEDKNGIVDYRNRAQGSFTVRIDRTPPRITATLDPREPSSGWYNTNVTVSFKCEDDRSGIASCTSPVTVSQEGEIEVRGEAVDKAGNKSTTSLRVRVDKTPPTGTLTINDGAATTGSTTVTLRISANDALSGVSEMRFSNDGRTWSEWESFQSTRSNWDLSRFGGQVSTVGPKTVYAQLRDRAGNVSQAFSAAIRLTSATLSGHTNSVWSVAFSPEGRLLASGSEFPDKTIKLWDVATGSAVATLSGHAYGVWSVAFSPDGRLLASGALDRTIKLWDVASRREVATLSGHTGSVNSVAFSPDGRLLASGSNDKTIKLWDVASRREVATLSGHTDWVRSVAFSPDGRLLASGSDDKTIKLWDVASRREVATLSGHTSSVWSVAFSPDGRLLASGSTDDTIKLWDLSAILGR